MASFFLIQTRSLSSDNGLKYQHEIPFIQVSTINIVHFWFQRLFSRDHSLEDEETFLLLL